MLDAAVQRWQTSAGRPTSVSQIPSMPFLLGVLGVLDVLLLLVAHVLLLLLLVVLDTRRRGRSAGSHASVVRLGHTVAVCVVVVLIRGYGRGQDASGCLLHVAGLLWGLRSHKV